MPLQISELSEKQYVDTLNTLHAEAEAEELEDVLEQRMSKSCNSEHDGIKLQSPVSTKAASSANSESSCSRSAVLSPLSFAPVEDNALEHRSRHFLEGESWKSVFSVALRNQIA